MRPSVDGYHREKGTAMGRLFARVRAWLELHAIESVELDAEVTAW